MCSTLRGEQIATSGIVVFAEEHLLPPVARLGNVMRDAGKNETSEAGHDAVMAWLTGSINLVHCHRNPSP